MYKSAAADKNLDLCKVGAFLGAFSCCGGDVYKLNQTVTKFIQVPPGVPLLIDQLFVF